MKKLYAIYDDCAKTAVLPLMAEVHEAAAVRGFTDAVRDSRSLLYAHPEDFSLIYVGSIDEETCVISAEPIPKLIVRASSVLEAKYVPDSV